MQLQYIKKFILLRWVQTVSISFLLTMAPASFAQTTAQDHAAHHQGEKEKEGEGMGGMMKNIGTPSKELYPSLMNLPTLSPEKRLAIQQMAHQRITSGIALMKGGLNELLSAANKNNYAKMQEALEKLREGIAQYESALAALRALSEGKNPRDIALQWFKREMNLLPSPPQSENILGGPFFHLTIIALFALFFLIMIWMYFFKMRRAAALLDRLTQQNAAVSLDATPQSSKTPEPTPSLSAESLKSSQVSKLPSEIAPTTPPTCPAHKCPVPQFPVMRSLTEPEEKWEGTLRVCRIFQEAPGIKTYHLASTHEVALPFTYYPGQFITLTALINGKTVRRSYTMASTPTQLHYCAITVKREEQGLFSRYLHDEIKEGDLLDVMGPNGKFTFTGEEAKSIVMICGGVGITPMMSIIRYLTDIGWHNDIYLLYCCRTTSEFIFREELEQLQERYLNLHVYASMLRSEGAVWMGLQGLFTKNIISHLVPDIASHRIHVCGPPAMMEAILASLKELNVPADLILTEAFGPEKKPEIAQEDFIKADTRSMVSFRKSEKMVPILPDRTLLEIAEANGVTIDNACRTGQCGLCKVKLLSGEVTMACEDALSTEDKQQGLILACQAKATKNIEVDA
ncbi:FAD-binding oxidoreductase [Legionella pneumophila serogroup 1]|uniref:NADH oxidoreductase hcr n=1 Tax=Fluoribacter dumoffii TaxID=463 RepID=A0A377GB89_9GAMM|nr:MULTISPECIES: 2Fe-2S iron-sulfur cluster-binding protein [Legionellaceae]KTC92784.1 oxidoreductase, FAD-binding protein [Fluoribacter dumoffii NY 23]MDW9174444.1 FAD-binding oxidoreductase [Legionella pneumophila]SNV18344.1 oxidoreductase, FAD-binding [Legionella pneumophila]STO22075.1 NADH oxidoreductase hcr [Fluoribacter dumoffii]HAT4425604.1 2Fe-2S iron-sulfur cluster binding domain-containing protein [Legionella pneumophila]